MKISKCKSCVCVWVRILKNSGGLCCGYAGGFIGSCSLILFNFLHMLI